MFKSCSSDASPWVLLVLHNIFPEYLKLVRFLADLPSNSALALEVAVLLAQPQPNWALLFKVNNNHISYLLPTLTICFKVLVMKNYKILSLILCAAIKSLKEIELTSLELNGQGCDCFLCPKDSTCKNDSDSLFLSQQQYYDIIVSAVQIFLCVGNCDELSKLYLPIIDKIPCWAHCFDRRHVSIC